MWLIKKKGEGNSILGRRIRQTVRFTQIPKQAVNDVPLIRPTQLHYARRAVFLPPDLSKVSTDVTWGCCSEESYVYWVEKLPDERSAVVLVVLTERHLQPVLVSAWNEQSDFVFYARVLSSPPLFFISHIREIVVQFSAVVHIYMCVYIYTHTLVFAIKEQIWRSG